MKICVINPGVVHALQRSLNFAKYFDEVHYVDIRGIDNRSIVEKNGMIYYNPFDDNNNRFGSIRLQKLFRRISPDGIVCHFALGTHVMNSVLYNKCPVGIIAMGHDILYTEGDGQLSFTTSLLVRMQLRRVDYISAKSIRLRKRILSFGVTAPVEVNYWGADLERFAPSSKSECRKRLGLPSSIPVVLSPRAIEPRLNIHLIVEALSKVKNTFSDVKLVMLGRSFKEYREQVEHSIIELGLSQNIEWREEVGHEDMRDYINASDVVVSVARSDGFPNTVLEVFACCVTVIIGEIPHVKDLVEDGHNVKMCKISVAAIAEAIIDVLSNPPAYAMVATQGYQTVRQFGDIGKNGERFAKAFKYVIDTRSKSKKSSFAAISFIGAVLVDKFYNKIRERVSF
jgi:glycosyltransferase involved in cell wall biosynthesis